MAEKKDSNAIRTDTTFTYFYSNSMETRNLLRTMLVKAQGGDNEKIPVFVSWPEWLDDGIVCLYARDLLQILASTVRETASGIRSAAEDPESALKKGIPEMQSAVLGDNSGDNVFAERFSSESPEHAPAKDIADLLDKGAFSSDDSPGDGIVEESELVESDQAFPSLSSLAKDVPPGKVSIPDNAAKSSTALTDELSNSKKKENGKE